MKLNVEHVGKEQVMMTPDKIKDVIEQTYDQYFSPKSINQAKEDGDAQNLRLLL